jgi:hypothetical protein
MEHDETKSMTNVLERKGLMQHSPSAPWRALKAALLISAVAVASLAFASVAGAAVLLPAPDGQSGSDNLTAAINTANTNASTSNTIVLSPGLYLPRNQPITITKNLNIVADHSFQAPEGVGAAIEVNGAQASTTNGNSDFLVVQNGVTLTLEGFNLDGAGIGPGNAAIHVNGNLVTYGLMMSGSISYAIAVGPAGTATINGSTFNGSNQQTLRNQGLLNLNNTTVWAGGSDGLDNLGGTFNMTDTIMANNGSPGQECIGGHAANGGPGTISDDSSCGVQVQNDTTLDGQAPIGDDGNGGPETTILFAPGGQTGIGVNCPTTDGRFFVNPGGASRTCDAGAVNNSATRQTAPPGCAITSTAADHSSQQVTVQDAASGVGPQAGPPTDNPSNTLATAYPPPAAAPVPGYAITNEQINNGTIAAFTPFTAPSTGGLVLTASKTTTGTPTQWSFTGINWAGVAKNCF